MKKAFKISIGILIVIVLLGGIFAGGLFYKLKEAEKVFDKIQINRAGMEDMLNALPDGEYIGECYPNEMVGARVRVNVKNHKIEAIELLEHLNGKGKPAEVLTDTVVEKQTLDVELVSGATGSSKVILKAIEDALTE